MKEIPILFSAPMVRALLAGKKTKTRRLVKPQPQPIPPHVQTMESDNGWWWSCHKAKSMVAMPRMNHFGPYGSHGDRLWVREEHYRFGHWEMVEGVKTKGGRQKWKFVADDEWVRFQDDADAPKVYRKGRHSKDPFTKTWHKRLARFMPRSLCRITLEVVSVRVERLQDIGEADALAEGIKTFTKDGFVKKYWPCDPCEGELKCAWADLPRSPVEAYRRLWQSLNGADSWAANPWVWVIEFKKL